MGDDLKTIWESLKAEPPDLQDPETLKRIDMLIAAIGELQKQFERERDHQPFVSQAPCPICGQGTVIYNYRAPLVGSIQCDTPQCIAHNL